jgi:2,4-dienoyl-CoA reductase-like NADH-dependent reductase (Old Yellow Enzyme family)
MKRLLEPLEIKDIILPNHIVFPAFQANYAAPEGFVTERLLRMCGKIAAGGSGLIAVCGPQVSDFFIRKSLNKDSYNECNNSGNCMFFLIGEKYVCYPRNPELQDG